MIPTAISFLLGVCTLHLLPKIPDLSKTLLIISSYSIVLVLFHYLLNKILKKLSANENPLIKVHNNRPHHKTFPSLSLSVFQSIISLHRHKISQSHYKLYLLSKPISVRYILKYWPHLLVNITKLVNLGFIFCLGFLYISMHASYVLAKRLPEDLHGVKAVITGKIASLPEVQENEEEAFVKFEFDPIEIKLFDSKTIEVNPNRNPAWQNPGRIKVFWKDPPLNIPTLPKPGDIWKFSLKLKRGRNYANPGSFDKEKYLFINRIAAEGFVLEKGITKLISRKWYKKPIDYLRQILYEKIKHILEKRPLAGMIVALVVGAKDGITMPQWTTLQDTGTAHLMAISGLHIGLVATAAFYLINYLWRKNYKLCQSNPSSRIAAIGALVAALFYSLLAGFSVPTQRSLVMVTVFMLAIIFRRNSSCWHSFFLALALVILLDPISTLSPGFWLSFGAVGMILYGMRGRFDSLYNQENSKMSLEALWWKWGRAQWVVFLGLMPITLVIFGKMSIISPIANLISIPWVSFLVVPLALLGAILSPMFSNISEFILGISERLLNIIWLVLEYIKGFPYSTWEFSELNTLSIIAAFVGILWLLSPKGLPGKFNACIFFLPLFFNSIQRPELGQARVTVLDVGQGLSTVVETKDHLLVFDTGPKLSPQFDTGDRVVVPYLKTRGRTHIDTLIISHGDNDHMGGMESITQKLNVEEIITSESEFVSKRLSKQPIIKNIELIDKVRTCYADQEWEWDHVKFKILHPDTIQTKKRNDHSCVLKVETGEQSVLITADIEAVSELKLINRYGNQLRSNILLVPHHGSRTSSSPEFIKMIQPEYAIIPVGFRNSYGHPKPDVVARYESHQVKIFDSIKHGAITFLLNGIGENCLNILNNPIVPKLDNNYRKSELESVYPPDCHKLLNTHYWLF